MTKQLFAFAVSFICAVTITAFVGQPCATAQSAAQLGEFLIKLEDPDPKSRSSAFYQLLAVGFGGDIHGRTYAIPSTLANLYKQSPGRADEIKVALIRLLEKENVFVQAQRREYDRTGSTLSEPYVDYYGDLIASVAALNDQRALNALLEVIDTGNMATRALAGFGRVALDQVLKRLNDPDANTRHAAARVLVQMLEPGNVKKVSDAVSKAKIKGSLIKATRDNNPYVRMTGVEGLAVLGDPSVIPLIERLAQSDPYKASGQGVQKGDYPVRESARKALERLK